MLASWARTQSVAAQSSCEAELLGLAECGKEGRFAQQVLEGVRKSPMPGWRFTLRAMRRVNIKYVDRAPMDEGLKSQLKQRYLPHVEELSELLDRDLTHWCR